MTSLRYELVIQRSQVCRCVFLCSLVHFLFFHPFTFFTHIFMLEYVLCCCLFLLMMMMINGSGTDPARVAVYKVCRCFRSQRWQQWFSIVVYIFNILVFFYGTYTVFKKNWPLKLYIITLWNLNINKNWYTQPAYGVIKLHYYDRYIALPQQHWH